MSHSHVHFFDVKFAEQYGVPEAIFLNYLRHHIEGNKANGINFHHGRTWSYNTYEALARIFPYFTVPQVKHLIKKLVDQKVIIKNKIRKSKSDHTNWYAFHDEDIFLPHLAVDKKESKYAICPIEETNLSDHEETNLSDLLNTIDIPIEERRAAAPRLALDDQFETFWKAYPRKEDKQDAKDAFKKLSPDKEMFGKMMAALENQKLDRERQKKKGENPTYWLYAVRWLKKRRWEDVIENKTDSVRKNLINQIEG